ncbi:hypothetical protein [Photobacterium galatheae]|uniref:Chromosome partitioning protein ParA n=1 Tax=Photobacterium galatheae TaxID=1654360 RepID=A0A066RSQ3_9GAMM|nr:hypothetical protein [Photobacterium galatheae]KDM93384.1 hypothetical protein EA58_00505 [Photobacterium galatheae]MCM0146963.1 protein SypD [Photobacterium galatheae]
MNTFSPDLPQIEQIYRHIVQEELKSVAITSVNAEEGVTSLAVALAQRHLLSGKNTLLVDLNLHHPTLLPVQLHPETATEPSFGTPCTVCIDAAPVILNGIIAPSGRADRMMLRRPHAISSWIKEWQATYDLIIFDTSPVSQTNQICIPPESVAAACDGCLLVVMAGKTTESLAESCAQSLRFAGARLTGTILNDQYHPPLRSEIQRELDRLPQCCRRLVMALRKKVSENKLLSIEL